MMSAMSWLRSRFLEAGLKGDIDVAGNGIGRIPTGCGRVIAIGSHVDSAP